MRNSTHAENDREWYDFLHGSGRVVEIDNRTGKVWGSYTLTYEGLLDENGSVPEAGTTAEDANAADSAAPEESPAA